MTTLNHINHNYNHINHTIEIIPAIDLIDGKCVRLTHGDYDHKTVYNEDPLEVAKEFEQAGIKRLHLVDLDGARVGSVVNWKVLKSIANNTSLKIDFGGGVKTESSAQKVLDSGAAFVTVGSIAVKKEKELLKWLELFQTSKVLLGADVRKEKITISGWQEQTDIDVFGFIEKFMTYGINHIFCTDVSKDGALKGPSIKLYKKIVQKFPDLHFIASGGVSSVNDITALENIGCKGVIIGKAIYEGRISLEELKQFLK
jgi:phosphoribosylformimino-5-aminoimidazole carboxamide ribotide isomerase